MKPNCRPQNLTMPIAALLFVAALPALAQPPAPATATGQARAAAVGAVPEAQAPQELLATRTSELQRLLTQPVSKERSRKIKELADSLVNYEELARRSLGDKQWAATTEPQHVEFVGLLQSLIEKNYIQQTEKNPGFQVRWTDKEMGKKGDRARVVSVASAKGDELELEYRLMLQPRGWIVYDLLVDGVSMTRNYNKTFNRIIAKQGWSGLIQRMKTKLAGGKDDELDRTATEGTGKKSK